MTEDALPESMLRQVDFDNSPEDPADVQRVEFVPVAEDEDREAW